MSLEERVKNLEESVRRLNDEVNELRDKITAMVVKMDILVQQNEKSYNLLKWIIFVLLGMVGLIIGFKVTPPT